LDEVNMAFTIYGCLDAKIPAPRRLRRYGIGAINRVCGALAPEFARFVEGHPT